MINRPRHWGWPLYRVWIDCIYGSCSSLSYWSSRLHRWSSRITMYCGAAGWSHSIRRVWRSPVGSGINAKTLGSIVGTGNLIRSDKVLLKRIRLILGYPLDSGPGDSFHCRDVDRDINHVVQWDEFRRHALANTVNNSRYHYRGYLCRTRAETPVGPPVRKPISEALWLTASDTNMACLFVSFFFSNCEVLCSFSHHREKNMIEFSSCRVT